jgi:ribosome-associated heat shock protein Hsp15
MRDDRQRIDRWLWHARLVRTRSAAAALAESGHVRLNGERVTASSRAVKIGDVLTVALTGNVRILRIEALVERRGGAGDAQRLYEDLTPPREPQAAETGPSPAGQREPGSGRPTKRDRRALERLRQRGSGIR